MGALSAVLSDSDSRAAPRHSNLYVSGLDPHLLKTEEQLRTLFEPYGHVETCRLVRNARDTKSFAFVKLASIQEALAAIAGLNKKQVGGTVLEVKSADAGERQPPAAGVAFAVLQSSDLQATALPLPLPDAGDRNPELLAPPSDNLYAKVGVDASD
jgi:RNA recognition motif-containing protein